MKLRSYISSLNAAEQVSYAQRCGIAVSYLRMHVKYASKDPSITLIRALVRESEGFVSMAEALEHFKLIDTLVPVNAA